MATSSRFELTASINEEDHAIGSPEAPVTIVEYGDYECPYCGRAEYQLDELQERTGNQVRIVFRHFPNRMVHPNAKLAAEAAEAAGAQGKFWEMHHLLFENQDKLAEQDLYQYAQQLTLDMDQFRHDLEQHTFAGKVRQQFRSGIQSGVRGTPTWFINGARYEGAWDAESLLEAIQKPLGMRLSELGHEFSRMAASGGLLLLVMSLLALLWANSSAADGYFKFWQMDLGFSFGQFSLSKHLYEWVNDALMVIFFFVIGLEIKREVTAGELNSLRKASMPLAAAAGGMLAPAMIYLLLNSSDPAAASGWGIPVATDIAFTLGLLTVLQGRIPLSLKVFFTAMAIADDLGAILVIALFYSSDLSLASLALAGAILLLLIFFNRARIFSPLPYAIAGVALWLAFLQSGIHPTIAGVLLALTIPTRSRANLPRLLEQTDTVLNRYDYSETDEESQEQALTRTLKTILDRLEPPAQRLEHQLQPWTTYLILPIFALANAGISLQGSLVNGLMNPVSLGIVLGLVLGKPLGISLFAWLAHRVGLAELPRGISWTQFFSASILAGIGFTMSLFITGAAFEANDMLNSAKLGILIGSVLAAVLGYAALNAASPRFDQATETPRRANSTA